MRKNSEWCTASIRNGHIEIRTPSGEKIPAIKSASVSEEVELPSVARIELLVKLDRDEETNS